MKSPHLLVALFLSFSLVWAQEPEKKEDPPVDPSPTEETIAALQKVVDGLEQATKDKSDVDILFYTKQVVETFKGGEEKQQNDLIGVLTKNLKSRNEEVRNATLQALSMTDDRALRPLLKELNGREAKDDMTYLSDCIAAVGRLHSEKAVKDLSKLLNHKENRVIAVTIVAFGDYGKADLGVRKNIVDTLLKRYGSVTSPMNKSNPSTSEKERFEALADSFESTLRRLTRQADIKTFDLWDKWYRKDGKKAKEW
ncbi:MAG: hypothetical protein KDB53_10835 [Planctomycetes bacterium]|nr:hypothetical protein [Planctomycetota bacterium]